ncbi:MAG: ABC transporter permease subunit [Planctomycetes bacterium]|nr:ABC transporter permease subunit [Planctomycetota bacterium]
MSQKSFTGVRRERKTRRSVVVADRAAKTLITVGGLGTIIAVATVCLFLVWVVIPLFGGSSVSEPRELGLPASSTTPVKLGFDEYRVLGWTVDGEGVLRSFRMDDSSVMSEAPLLPAESFAGIAFSPSSGAFVLADRTGGIRFGKVEFATSFIEEDDLPTEVAEQAAKGLAIHDGGVIQRTPEGQFRRQRLALGLGGSLTVDGSGAARLLDFSHLGEKESVAVVLDQERRLFLCRSALEMDFMTGEDVLSGQTERLDYEARDSAPEFLRVSARGDSVLLAWSDGSALRFDCTREGEGKVAESLQLVPQGRKLVRLDTMIGHETFLACDDQGGVALWFKAKPEGAATSDGAVLVHARDLEAEGSPVTATASSRRSRIVALGYADGRVRLYQTTSAVDMIDETATGEGPALVVAMGPKEDSVAAVRGRMITAWDLELGHPEATLGSLFGKVWYEGYPEPEHVWQSSAGSDSAEPKLGLMPLIFGSIKATIYSLLFGVPLALLAAIFTSEFLDPRHKAKVKPTVELMASLPSVVLGFLAALVVAPFVENRIPALLCSLVTIPMVFLLGAQVWQALPTRISLRYGGVRLVGIIVLLPLGVWSAGLLGPWVEDLFFVGDIKHWLNGGVGDSTGGWMLILLPLVAIGTAWLMTRVLDPVVRARGLIRNRKNAIIFSATKLVGGSLVALLGCWLIATVLDGMGLDSRGGVLDTYVARNALVVGFIMGFAIIPIIYTIAEDALSTVPEHLRAASLGAGATPWQTALRIVVPTAMSGLFSAVMIGLGRAVGETMIVLMAAGNTPVMEWNIFNGFRTLSANIAVELPEAVRDSTHYRTLFLAALVLFVLTFILNTFAEVVRQRFRKRAYQL